MVVNFQNRNFSLTSPNKMRNDLSFKAHTLSIDIGTGNELVPMYVRCVDDCGHKIYSASDAVFNSYDAPRDPKTFLEAIADKIQLSEHRNRDEIERRDPSKELKVVIAFPGQRLSADSRLGEMFPNFVSMPNILGSNNKPLGCVDIEKLPEILASKGVQVHKYLAVNSMAALGACLLKKMKEQHPEQLQEGREIPFIYAGNEMGTGTIAVDQDEIRIVPRERQRAKVERCKESIGSNSGCTSALIKNYKTAIEEQGVDLSNAKNLKSIEKIDSFRMVTGSTPPLKEISLEQHRIAQKLAISSFVDGIGQMIAMEITGGKTKTAILAGPIIQGVISAIQENPLDVPGIPFETYPSKNLNEVIIAATYRHLTGTGHNLEHNFKIIHIPLHDNTEGAGILVDSKSTGNGDWFGIPKKSGNGFTALA